MNTPDNWQEYLPRAWESLAIKQRAEALCDFDKSYYTPTERVSARALRQACLPLHEQPEGLVEHRHAGLELRRKAQDLARAATQRASLPMPDDRPRWTPPLEALGIDPKASTNTIHGVELEMVRKQGPHRKFWVLRSKANGREYPGRLTGETRPKMWDNFAWFNYKRTPEEFHRSFGQ